jgi:hypothetical protein
VRGYCQELNCPYEQIQKTTLYMAPIAQSGHLDPAALDYLKALGKLGVDEVMVRAPSDSAAFELFAAELIPLVNAIPVAGR